MDFTNLLQTFFVANKTQPKKTSLKKTSPTKTSPTKTPPTKTHKKEQVKDIPLKEKELTEELKEEFKISEIEKDSKKYSDENSYESRKYSDENSYDESRKYSDENSYDESRKYSDEDSNNDSSKDSSSSDSERKYSDSDSYSDSYKSRKYSDEESKKQAQLKGKKTSDKYVFKKLVLKANDFYKKNLILINKDDSKNIELISDILYKLNTMKNVKELYSNNLYINSFNESKKQFKEILLDNPNLYFNNFKFNTKLKDLDDNSKRIVVILDFNYITENPDEYLSKNNLLEQNIQLIILYSNYSSDIIHIYNLLSKQKPIIINSKDKLKLLQKKFYSKIVKPILQDKISHDDFISTINDDNLDVKNIIIKDNTLRYN